MTGLPPFRQPTAAQFRAAHEIVDSRPVISAYGSCEFDDLHDDGKVWIAAIVREAQARVAPNAQKIADMNAFICHMADRYRARTMRCVFGLWIHRLTRSTAMTYALATFEQAIEETPFGTGDLAWDRDHAHDLVDEDLRHWDAA